MIGKKLEFDNTDIHVYLLHKLHIIHNDCMVKVLLNDYFLHISYILLQFLNIILALLPLNLSEVLSEKKIMEKKKNLLTFYYS